MSTKKSNQSRTRNEQHSTSTTSTASNTPPAARTPHERATRLAHLALQRNHPNIGQELQSLSPEEAAAFITLVEKALAKRRILLTGYVVAGLCMLAGMLTALYVYGTRTQDQFMGWIFLLPFVAVGITLVAFGRWARKQ